MGMVPRVVGFAVWRRTTLGINMINRRRFLASILAAGMAPAVIKAANLMPVRALPSGVLIAEDIATQGSILRAQEFVSDGVFTVPRGVSSVWLSCYGAGGGGGSGECVVDYVKQPIKVPPSGVITVGNGGGGKTILVEWVE